MKRPFSLSSSNCNLFAEINAISTPLKNAENNNAIIAKEMSIYKNNKIYSNLSLISKVPLILAISYLLKSGEA